MLLFCFEGKAFETAPLHNARAMSNNPFEFFLKTELRLSIKTDGTTSNLQPNNYPGGLVSETKTIFFVPKQQTVP